MNPPKEHRNRAYVILHKAGVSFYSIQMAFGEKDKRNITKVWKRDKDKYHFNPERSYFRDKKE